MKLRKLTLTDFGSHRQTTVDWPDGVIGVIGRNGAGKSTLFKAVMWGLYGNVAKVTNPELLRTGSLRMGIGVEFEHRGGLYAVTREWKAGGRLTGLQFDQVTPNAEPLTEATMALTEHAIADLIGSRHVALATWYAGQDAMADLFDARPAERMGVVNEALGLSGRWAAIHKAANIAYRDTDTECAKAWATIEALDITPDAVTEAAGAYAAAQEAAVAAEEALRAATGHREAILAKVAALEKQQAEHNQRELTENGARTRFSEALTRSDQIDMALKTNAALLADEAEIKAAEAAAMVRMAEYQQAAEIYSDERANWLERMRLYEDAKTRAADRVKRVEALQVQLDALGTGSGIEHCPTCKQPIHDEEARSQVATRRAAVLRELHTAESERIIIPDDAGPHPQSPARPKGISTELAERLNALATARAERTRLEAQRTEAEATRQQAESAHKAAQDAVTAPLEWGTVRTDADAAEGALSAAQHDLTNAQTAEGITAHTLKTRTDGFERKQALEKSAADLEAKLEIQRLVAECAAPSGARQLVIDSAIPAIEAAANDLLATLQPGATLHLETQRADSERETLDIRILDEVGYRRVETMSGGEKTRVMLATRWAFSLAAADAHGLGGLPMFVIDEAFGNQDNETARPAIIHGLQELSKRVDQVVLVTHQESLIGDIQQVLRVEQHGTESKATWL